MFCQEAHTTCQPIAQGWFTSERGRHAGSSRSGDGCRLGLGAETAALFPCQGADVMFACDTRPEPLKATVDGLRSEGLNVESIGLDVSDEESWVSTLAQVVRAAGRLDAELSGANPGQGQFSTESTRPQGHTQ
jgi:NAD(P)-dependent dehydrogenase (short-subunit alcohol dehydrogenase family)